LGYWGFFFFFVKFGIGMDGVGRVGGRGVEGEVGDLGEDGGFLGSEGLDFLAVGEESDVVVVSEFGFGGVEVCLF
jgi:hypothetical protein